MKNIVFDCSDTLLRFSAMEELGKVMGDAEKAAEIKMKIHASHGWHQYDKGLISEEGLREEILPLFEESDRPYAAWYLDHWVECYAPIPGMFEIVAELKEKGWPLYIISDFPPCFSVLKNRFPALFACFTDLAVSYECQCIKGDKSLFQHFLDRFHCNAAECVFIDDVPRLVENARSLGFHGIIAENAGYVRSELSRLNIL